MPQHLTIAICTWNRCALLRQTLERFLQLQIPAGLNWEVLVVDNNSRDRTKHVVAEFAQRLPVRYVFESRVGLSRARNRAIEESDAEFIVFTDDDVLVDPDWLVSFWHAVREFPEGAAFGGPVEPWWVRQPDPELAEVFWRLKIGFCGLDHRRPFGPLADLPLIGANMAFRKSLIGPLRFDPQLGRAGRNQKSDDENEFIARLRERGGVVIWVPTMRVKHYVDPERMTLSYLCRVTVGDGKVAARLEGIPEHRGPKIGGVPRWLLRRCVELRFQAFRQRLAGRRLQSLVALREYCLLRGLISETWLIRREEQRREAPSA